MLSTYIHMLLLCTLQCTTTAQEKIPLQWQFQQLPEICEKRGACAEAAYNEATVLMFDGFTTRTWIFTAQTWASKVYSQTLHWPSARLFHKIAQLHDGTVLLFGGEYHNNQYYGDTFIFSETTLDWTEIFTPAGGGRSPAPRSYHAMATLKEGTAFLFGGQNKLQYFDDSTSNHPLSFFSCPALFFFTIQNLFFNNSSRPFLA